MREAHKAWSVSARLPLARAEVRACAVDLVALALRLRADEPIDLRGAAMAARLVLNGTSPLYGDSAGHAALRRALGAPGARSGSRWRSTSSPRSPRSPPPRERGRRRPPPHRAGRHELA